MPVIGSGGLTVNVAGLADMRASAGVARIVTGNTGIVPLFRSAERTMAPTDTLAYGDGVVGGAGDLALPPYADSSAAQAFLVSAFMGPITITPDDGDQLYDATNTLAAEIVVPDGSVFELLHYAGVWRVTNESPTTGGGGPPGPGVTVASVVLYCPDLDAADLTPTDGDDMYWVDYTPNLDAPDPLSGLSDWTTREAFTWSEGWATNNDPTNVLMLTDVDETWLPTLLCEVTATGFTQIPVLGGQPIVLGCGGAVDFSSSLWTGWNVGESTQGGGIDPTLPATLIVPAGMTADSVRIVDRTGSGFHVTLADWYATVNGRATTHYEASIAVQPWQQDGADFGVSATVTAHGHVTRTDAYWADATITFYSTVDVTTPGTGQPRFYVREFIRSFDADFAGWQWGWNDPVARCPVNGLIGGLPFVGFVDNDGYILDADGTAISRVLQTGDNLSGTVTGVFQND